MNTQTLSNQPTAAVVAPATDFVFVAPTVATKEGYKAFVKSYKEAIKRLGACNRLLKQSYRAQQKDSKKPWPNEVEMAYAWAFFKQLREAMLAAKLPMTIADPDKADRIHTLSQFTDAHQLASYLIALRRAYKVLAQEAYLKAKEAA